MRRIKSQKGQAVLEAIFSLLVFGVLAVAIFPLYFSILNNYLIPAVQNEAFGSIMVLGFQVLPLLVVVGIAFAIFSYFRPRITQV